MNLFKRFVFYFVGFAIGLVFLFFIKDKIGFSFEFDYFPNARTLKEIRNKERMFSENSLQFLKNNQLDTSTISYILKKGNVLFSESNTKLDSCKIYIIEGKSASKESQKPVKNLKIAIQNCSKTATVQNIKISGKKN